MRYFGLFILQLTLIFSCGGSNGSGGENENEEGNDLEVCDCNDLVFDQAYNNFYLEVPREGFTGKCETYYGNGNLAMSKHFKGGKVHGELIKYYENGEVKEKKEFDLSFQNGDHYIYSKTGELLFHARYERGKQKEIIFSAP